MAWHAACCCFGRRRKAGREEEEEKGLPWAWLGETVLLPVLSGDWRWMFAETLLRGLLCSACSTLVCEHISCGLGQTGQGPFVDGSGCGMSFMLFFGQWAALNGELHPPSIQDPMVLVWHV